MRVLLVVEAALGGSGRHVLDLAEGLMARGETVHLIYSPLRADYKFTTGLASLRRARSDFRCHFIPIARELGVSDFRSYLQLTGYVRRHGPFDVIHGHSTKAGFLARLLLWRRGARLIYTPHGLMTLNPGLTGLPRRAVCTLESTFVHLSDAVVAVSSNEHLCAIETGIKATKLIVISNGLHQVHDSPEAERRKDIRNSLGVSPDTVCIGWIGRLVAYKEPGRVLESFAILKQHTAHPVRLVMIGWGPLEAAVRQRATELRISNDVLFLGQVDGAAHAPAFDILAHSSRFEAFGYVFLEALSSGVPIVTTHVGGTDELVTDGVTGYICDPWDAKVFAAYLQRLIENPQLRATMALAARERAARFGVARMVDSIQELYRRVCDVPNSDGVDQGAAQNAFEQSS
jgi:glycosyltransferase involved in cell wall biosynthesis